MKTEYKPIFRKYFYILFAIILVPAFIYIFFPYKVFQVAERIYAIFFLFYLISFTEMLNRAWLHTGHKGGWLWGVLFFLMSISPFFKFFITCWSPLLGFWIIFLIMRKKLIPLGCWERTLHDVPVWNKTPKNLQQRKILTEGSRLSETDKQKELTFLVEEDKTRREEFIENNYKEIEILGLGKFAENIFNNANHCADETETILKKTLDPIQYTQIICEFLYLFLYLIDRYCYDEFNLDERDKIMDPLVYGICWTIDEVVPPVNPKFQRKMTLAEKIRVSSTEEECWRKAATENQETIIKNANKIVIPTISFSKDSEWFQRCREYSNYKIIWESYGNPFKDTVWGECIKHVYKIAYECAYERNNPEAFLFSTQVFNLLSTYNQGHIKTLNEILRDAISRSNEGSL